jgi:anti-sigma regulatory factor (Ser/Thr protein kinase)
MAGTQRTIGLGMGDLAISDSAGARVMARPLAIGGRGMAAPGIPTQELWLRADPVELRTARRFAEAAADDFGLDADARFRFTLAVNEAVANAIEHGAPSADGRVQLRIAGQGDSLTFEVRDWGSFSVSKPNLGKLQERGRGLAMMATLVDEVDLKPSDDSTIVRLRVKVA